jgi:hypothetical protein
VSCSSIRFSAQAVFAPDFSENPDSSHGIRGRKASLGESPLRGAVAPYLNQRSHPIRPGQNAHPGGSPASIPERIPPDSCTPPPIAPGRLLGSSADHTSHFQEPPCPGRPRPGPPRHRRTAPCGWKRAMSGPARRPRPTACSWSWGALQSRGTAACPTGACSGPPRRHVTARRSRLRPRPAVSGRRRSGIQDERGPRRPDTDATGGRPHRRAVPGASLTKGTQRCLNQDPWPRD